MLGIIFGKLYKQNENIKKYRLFQKTQRNYEVKNYNKWNKKLQQKYLLYYGCNITVHKSP